MPSLYHQFERENTQLVLDFRTGAGGEMERALDAEIAKDGL